MSDHSQLLQQQVESAWHEQRPLKIRGSGSKQFYTNPIEGDWLEISEHQGVLEYEPTELVITARSGTSLHEIQQTLAAQQQRLAFDPPAYGPKATIGGTVAGNFSGPGRISGGAVRDSLLGCRILNGKGEILKFGGQVMKNVAGYDVSRLMCGALGNLGVLLEVSLKVMPIHEAVLTLKLDDIDAQSAIKQLQHWQANNFPIEASCWFDQALYLKLAGSPATVAQAQKQIAAPTLDAAAAWWHSIREQNHAFFTTNRPLWRLSVAANTSDWPDAAVMHEWHGNIRWLHAETEAVREFCQQHQGHAVLYRNPWAGVSRFQPLSAPLLALHQRLKQAFDPARILNRGILYPEL